VKTAAASKQALKEQHKQVRHLLKQIIQGVVTPQAWIKEPGPELSGSEVLALPGGF
jgi:hypothetical protein